MCVFLRNNYLCTTIPLIRRPSDSEEHEFFTLILDSFNRKHTLFSCLNFYVSSRDYYNWHYASSEYWKRWIFLLSFLRRFLLFKFRLLSGRTERTIGVHVSSLVVLLRFIFDYCQFSCICVLMLPYATIAQHSTYFNSTVVAVLEELKKCYPQKWFSFSR